MQQAYDKEGQWAASGQIDTGLLSQLLSHPYFASPYPKSTGREDFNLMWLQNQLDLYLESPNVHTRYTLASITTSAQL